MALFDRLVKLFDQSVARWEVSRLSFAPLAATALLFWPMMIAIKLVAVATGASTTPLARAMLGVWVAMLGLELARRIWTARHRYASPRWLRAVQHAVGQDVAVHSLADLMRQHRHDLDYVVTRSDMVRAVQEERFRCRDTARRAEGFRLVEESPQAQPEPQPLSQRSRISDEQRARARERRAARRARAAT